MAIKLMKCVRASLFLERGSSIEVLLVYLGQTEGESKKKRIGHSTEDLILDLKAEGVTNNADMRTQPWYETIVYQISVFVGTTVRP